MKAIAAITTPFGFDSTAAQVAAGIDLTGKRVIVTGASSGIGVETARVLAGAGADVTLAVRDTDAGERTAADITATTGNTAIHVGQLDLAAAGDARIVSLSSRGHLRSPVIFDDLNFTSRPYDPWLAYGQSKTANVLFAVEAARRWGGEGITANAVHPGAIFGTNLSRHMDREVLAGLRAAATGRSKTVEQGAVTPSWSPPHHSSRASAAATSRTATRRPSSTPSTRTPPPASPPTHSTPATPSASGTSPCGCCGHRVPCRCSRSPLLLEVSGWSAPRRC